MTVEQHADNLRRLDAEYGEGCLTAAEYEAAYRREWARVSQEDGRVQEVARLLWDAPEEGVWPTS